MFSKSFQTRRKAPNPNKVIGGKIAHARGDMFEDMVLARGQANGWTVELLPPSGCRWLNASKPISMPIQLDGWAAKDGKVLFFDCKSINSTTISKSHFMSKPHQLEALQRMQKQKITAGYLVHFQLIDSVVFLWAGQVAQLEPRKSLSDSDGIKLGPLLTHNLDKILLSQNKTLTL